MKRAYKQNFIYTDYKSNEKIVYLIHDFIQTRIDHYFCNSKLELMYTNESLFINTIRQQIKPDLYHYIATLLTQYSNYLSKDKITDFTKLIDLISMKWDVVINSSLDARIRYIQSNHIHTKAEYMNNINY